MTTGPEPPRIGTPPPASNIPAPELWVIDAEPVVHAAAPTLAFTLRVRERSDHGIYTIALKTEIHVEPAHRTYTDEERDRLADLFGEPERWSAGTQNFLWERRDVLVPSFDDVTKFQLTVPCGADMELGATKYFSGLEGGEVPLIFHFSGTVLYSGPDDRLQVTQVPWSSSTDFRLPVETWRAAVEAHWPGGGFVRLSEDTLAELRRYRLERGLPSIDATVAALLAAGRLEIVP